MIGTLIPVPRDFRSRTGPSGWLTASVARKRAYWAVKDCYDAPLPPALDAYPKVSVVICVYNGERTLDACLASLKTLNYPNYEVVVVNDGSTDASRQIAERYDNIVLINQENKGLSEARNVGISRSAAAKSLPLPTPTVRPTPIGLAYLVARFQRSEFAAVGGPNLSPPDDSMIPSCVAVSPGAPTHVLLDDEVAEHIPGCNMAFRPRSAASDRRL